MSREPQQIRFIPVTLANKANYIKVGIQSYREHYLHLWPNADPSPYLSNNYTDEIVTAELQNEELLHYLVACNSTAAGLFKLVTDTPLEGYGLKEALLVEKIYLLAEYSGMGLGKECISFIVDKARKMDKKVIWLDTMKYGRALDFYLKYGFEIIGEKELPYPSALEDQKAMVILKYDLD